MTDLASSMPITLGTMNTEGNKGQKLGNSSGLKAESYTVETEKL